MPSSKGKDAAVSKVVKDRVADPLTAVDAAEFLVHYLVKAALQVHRKRWGRPPRLMYLPKAIEAAVQIDLGRSEDRHVHLREGGAAQELFGCPVVWDADEFKVE